MIVAAYSVQVIFGAVAAALVVGAALVGLLFRNAAEAWKDERDAAVARADRLEEKVVQQGGEIADLKSQVEQLKLTNVKHLGEQMHEEHAAMVSELRELVKASNAHSTILEFFCKQVFPTAVTNLNLDRKEPPV